MFPSRPAGAARPGRLPLALVFLLAPPLLLWPLPLVFAERILSAPHGEAAGHLWALEAALRAGRPLSAHTDLCAWPTGADLLLIDPANLPFFTLGRVAGPAAAYNAILLGGLLLMGIAGAWLAREIRGEPWLGALAAMACPAFLAGTLRGATEQLAVGWVGLGLALLLAALRAGGAARLAAAALALGACAWAGPYNGLWAALLLAAVGIGVLRRPGPGRRRWLVVAVGAGLAMAPVAAAIQGGFAVMNDPRFGSGAALPLVERLTRARGGDLGFTDLLDPWVPAPLTGPFDPLSQTTYLGAVLLLAAGLAVARLPARWPWLAGAVAAAAVSLGPALFLGGDLLRVGGLPLPGPARLLQAAPFLVHLTHWYRAAPVAGLLLAALASTWGGRRWAPLLALALLCDATLLAPFPWPLPGARPPGLGLGAALVGEGAVLELPWSTPQDPPPGAWRNAGGLFQVEHGHPIAGGVMRLGTPSPSPDLDAVLAAIERGRLDEAGRVMAFEHGFRWLAVHVDHRPAATRPLLRRRLEASLGPPLAEDERVWVFGLAPPTR